MQSTLNEPESASREQIAPWLDKAMAFKVAKLFKLSIKEIFQHDDC